MRENDHRHLSERDLAAALLPAAASAGERARSENPAEPIGDCASGGETSPSDRPAIRVRRAGSSPPRPVSRSAAASTCPQCRAQLEEAARLAHEFQTRVLPRTLPCIHQRAAATSSARWRTWLRPWLAAPLAVAAALLLLAWPRLQGARPSRYADAGLGSFESSEPAEPVERLDELYASGDGEPELRTKSASSSARLLLRRGDAVQRLWDGAVVHPGDALAFLVDPGPSRFALVVSIDGAATISVYSPYGGSSSGPVAASALPTALEPSIILDDTLGPERVWLLVSEAPLPVAQLRPALERLAAAGPAALERATAEELIAALAPEQRLRVDVTTWLITKVAP